MTRTTYVLAGVGLVLLPVGATAFGWRYRTVPHAGPVYAPPEVVFLSPCPPPIPIYPLADCPPASAAPAAAAPANPPKVMEKEKTAAPPPQEANPIRPAGFAAPAAADPPAEKPPVITVPNPAAERPMGVIPKPDVPAAPPTQESRKPDTPVDPPKPDALKLELPPDPTATPPVPGGTPPLVIPNIPGSEPRTSKYTPAAGRRPGTDVIPVEGPKPAGGWKVGFYNYTAADLTVTVNGKDVALPAKSSVSVPVGATFTWKVTGGGEETAAVPADGGGYEVVIK